MVIGEYILKRGITVNWVVCICIYGLRSKHDIIVVAHDDSDHHASSSFMNMLGKSK